MMNICKIRILKQFFATAIISLCLTSDGMQFGWQSPATKYLRRNDSSIEGFNDDIDTAIQVVFLVCGVACTPLVTYLADKIGRKWTSIFGSSLNLISWLSIAFTKHAEVLIFSKMLASISYCCDMVMLPMYVSEISEKGIRGFFLGYVLMSAMLGIIVIYVIFPPLPIFASSLVGACLNAIQIIVFSFMPESPYFLIKVGKTEKAAKTLQYFRGKEDITEELKEIEDSLAAQKLQNAKLKDIFKDAHSKKALVICCFLQFMVPLGALSVMTMNLHTILGDNRVLFDEDFTTIGFACTLFASQLICMATIDYFGRKPLMLFSIVGCNVTLFSFSTYFTTRDFHPDADYTYASWIPEVSIIVYALCYRQGLGTVPTTLCAEMFPTKHKAAGLSITFVTMTVVDAIVVLVFKQLSKVMKPYYTFFILVGISLFNIPFVIFLVPETKGRTLEEIQQSLDEGWVRKKMTD